MGLLQAVDLILSNLKSDCSRPWLLLSQNGFDVPNGARTIRAALMLLTG